MEFRYSISFAIIEFNETLKYFRNVYKKYFLLKRKMKIKKRKKRESLYFRENVYCVVDLFI